MSGCVHASGHMETDEQHVLHSPLAVAAHDQQQTEMTLAGLEPAIFGSEDQRLIH